jgi:1,4-alpha-glucan branching enzyme
LGGYTLTLIGYSSATPWGPRFNYSNPIVKKFLVESARYIMKHYRIDGFRFDATVFINDWGFLQYVTTQLRNFASSDNVILITEHLPNLEQLLLAIRRATSQVLISTRCYLAQGDIQRITFR